MMLNLCIGLREVILVVTIVGVGVMIGLIVIVSVWAGWGCK